MVYKNYFTFSHRMNTYYTAMVYFLCDHAHNQTR